MGAAATLSGIIECKKSDKVTEAVPKRLFGRTGEKLSMLGLGGVVLMNEEQTVANEAVAMAFDRGINYYDVAPSYGNAEEKMGPALEPYRSKSFLACKTTERSAQGADKELHESLEKLKTDHFDLYQLHALSSIEDVEQAFGPGGAMETVLKAKEAGKIRFIGFSAHSQEAALLALEKYDFDTTLYPINYVCWYQGGFGPEVVKIARERKMGISALKSLGRTIVKDGEEKKYEKCWYHPVPFNDDELALKAMTFTLSKADLMVPPGEPAYFWKAMDLIHKVKPVSTAEPEDIQKLSEGIDPIFSA